MITTILERTTIKANAVLLKNNVPVPLFVPCIFKKCNTEKR